MMIIFLEIRMFQTFRRASSSVNPNGLVNIRRDASLNGISPPTLLSSRLLTGSGENSTSAAMEPAAPSHTVSVHADHRNPVTAGAVALWSDDDVGISRIGGFPQLRRRREGRRRLARARAASITAYSA